MDPIMVTQGLTKIYGDRVVVDEVDLEQLYGGDIFGLGPNGSGKSTTIRMLTGLTQPSEGSITMRANGGHINVLRSPLALREHAAILTETPSVYERMELFQYLKLFGQLSRIPQDELVKKILEVISITGMEDHMYRVLRQMSMGERQRVEIARVLLKDSPVLFLDEPFNGIDITTRRELRDYLKNHWLNENRCIFFTSHNLLESEHFVDRFSFLYEGKIIASGDESELKNKFLVKKFVIYLQDLQAAQKGLAILVKNDLVEEGEVVNNLIYITLKSREEVDDVIRTLVEGGVSFYEIHPKGTIEDVFIGLVEDKKKQDKEGRLNEFKNGGGV